MEEAFTVWHNVPHGTFPPRVMSVEAMQNLCDKYGFGDGGKFLLAAAPVVPQAPQVPQVPRDAALIQCYCLDDVAYKIVRLMTPGTPAEATVSAHSAASTVSTVSTASTVSIVPSGAARSTGPIRRAGARRSRKFNPVSEPQMPYGRYPDIPKDLKQKWSSPKSPRLLQRITFGVLESTYVGSHGAASIAACEEGANREQLFVQILGAIEALSAQKTRVLDAKNSAVAPFSARDAYFTKDHAVLRQTLRGFIQAAFDAEEVDKVCAAFIDVLHRNGHDGLVDSSALWSRSPRTMLDMPLRSLCGITTMLPHFHFAQKAFEGESSESSGSSDEAKPSRLQRLVEPIKARLEAMAV